jgi:hypothetical protein
MGFVAIVIGAVGAVLITTAIVVSGVMWRDMSRALIHKTCPDCRTRVLDDVRLCGFCRYPFEQAAVGGSVGKRPQLGVADAAAPPRR